MSPVSRLASVHLGFLILCAPLLVLVYVDGVHTTQAGKWSFSAIASTYAAMAVLGKPGSVFEGLYRLGVANRSARCLVIAATLFAASVPIHEMGSIGKYFGYTAIFAALGFLFWATVIALFPKISDFEIT